jgi:predicted small lipoprotein YifL
MISYSRATVALFALSLAACGQKGPLYMPDTTQGEIVTRPTQSTSDGATTGSPNSPAPPDSPDRAAPPAPEVTAPAGTPPPSSNEEGSKKDKKQPPK